MTERPDLTDEDEDHLRAATGIVVGCFIMGVAVMFVAMLVKACS